MSKCKLLHGCVLLCLAIFAILVLLITSGRASAQAQTATITGTATDASGAAIVGAKIVATNTETGVSQSTVTNPQGVYSIPDLNVGTYTVQASQSGFQTVVKKGVILTVGATIVENLTLPVGQVSQTVSVEANAAQVETQTSQVSNLVAPTQVANLPLNGRNIEQLLTLTPGVTAMAPTVNFVTGRMYGMQDNYSISGARPTGQMFLLDGTDIRDFWEHGIGSGYAGTELGISSISQFQVITSNGNAQYAGNGIVSEVSKSGTNDFHGGAYEYFRNNALDARDVDDPISGPPPFRQNQFGVDAGGPIKKNKLFFFGNYEGLRNSLSTTIPGLEIAEPYVAQGMLPCYDIYGRDVNVAPVGTCPGMPAGSVAAGGNTPVAVGSAADPILPVAGANTRAEQIDSLYKLCKGCQPYANTFNYFAGGQPVALLQPAGTDFGGFSYVSTAPPLTVDENYVLGRIDYNIGTNDSMFGRYVLDRANVGDGPEDPLSIFPETDFTRNQYLTIAENHIVSATMVNVIRFGFVRTAETMTTALGLSPAQESAAGVTSDPLDFVRTLYNEPGRPDGQISPGGTQPLGPDQNRPNIYDNKFSGGDDLSWTHGAHTLKLGMVVTRVQVNVDQESYAAGNSYLVYSPPFVSPDNNATSGLEPYITGAPAVIGYADPPGYANSTRYFREIDIAPYFQDDWRVTSQLTLNIGLRYDYGTNPVGWAGGGQPLTALIGSFLPPIGPQAPTPACVSGLGATPSLVAAADCSLQYYSPVHHVFANNANANNWEPRFGFAYSPFKNNKTAIRGGVGVFDDPTAARIYESGYTATPPASSFLVYFPSFPNTFANATCVLGSTNPFIACPQPSEFAGVTYQDGNGSPYTIQYNFDIQQQLTPGTVLTVGYVGSVSRHLWNQRDINPPQCTTFPDCTALPSVPSSLPTASNSTYTVNTMQFVGGAPVTTSPDSCVEATPVLETSCYGSGARLPYVVGPFGETPGARINPIFGEMITEAETAASSYNSLQVGLNHQFSRSLSGQVNYTYSHCIDDGSFATSLEEFAQLETDTYNQAYDYASCDFDVRNNLSVNGIYALPFKGNRLVSGWQIATILGVHSGLPVNIVNAGTYDPADLGTESDSRPNYSFAAGCSPNHLVKKYVAQGVYQWFNSDCYEPQAPGFFGNVGRNSMVGPGTLDLDASVIKNTKLTERVNMQFRAEAFNIMNHFNPGDPAGSVFQTNGEDGQVRASQAPIVTPRQIQFALKFDF